MSSATSGTALMPRRMSRRSRRQQAFEPDAGPSVIVCRLSPLAAAASDGLQRWESGDLEVAAHRGDLVGNSGEVDVRGEPHRGVDGTEEVVEVAGDDRAWLQSGQDSRPVVVCEAAPGDAGEEHVDAAVVKCVVDEVRAALVVEGRSRDLDVDTPHLTALVGGWREGVEMLAGKLAVKGDREAEQQLRVQAWDK